MMNAGLIKNVWRMSPRFMRTRATGIQTAIYIGVFFETLVLLGDQPTARIGGDST